MISASRKFTHILLFLAILAFFSMNIIGTTHTFGMELQDDGAMGDCPFTDHATVCAMSIPEHLSIWQGMFTAAPQKNFAIIFFLFVAVAVAVPGTKRQIYALFMRRSSRWRMYIKERSRLQPFHYLREALSQGILNPKIYDLAMV